MSSYISLRWVQSDNMVVIYNMKIYDYLYHSGIFYKLTWTAVIITTSGCVKTIN
jgi:hypothetical protein